MNEYQNETVPKRIRQRRELSGEANWLLNIGAFLFPGLSIVLLFATCVYPGGLWLGMGGWGIFIIGVILLPIIGVFVSLGTWFASSSRKWRSAAVSALIGWLLMVGFAAWFWANSS